VKPLVEEGLADQLSADSLALAPTNTPVLLPFSDDGLTPIDNTKYKL